MAICRLNGSAIGFDQIGNGYIYMNEVEVEIQAFQCYNRRVFLAVSRVTRMRAMVVREACR